MMAGPAIWTSCSYGGTPSSVLQSRIRWLIPERKAVETRSRASGDKESADIWHCLEGSARLDTSPFSGFSD
ncbi:hypothetical protein PAPYR_12150 [Paratrimastix pyriformis]|uniref:Uncharacterized protein n=1 Tax=Paratrimastix pyriformis TaxID=342808 RepID=A0ABQ8U6B7_9EUKA|nr:hypothetical protein PAPYR_12150 [Paratrimastix pyriformis]